MLLLVGPCFVCEHDRGIDLANRDCPVFAQQAFLVRLADEREAVALVERDRPGGGGPGADEDGLLGLFRDVAQEFGAGAFALVVGGGVGVADEGDVGLVLDAHHGDELVVVFGCPEFDAVVDFVRQFLYLHVGVVPAVGGDGVAVGLCGVVDDCEDVGEVGGVGGAEVHEGISMSINV